jgi:hypothetical protein
MRRYALLLLVMAFAMALVTPAAGANGRDALEITVGKAVVSPDGTAAGEITDVVFTFVDPDPAIAGISLKKDATITIVFPDDFVNTGAGAVQPAILQGWPQSPPAPPPLFPWVASVNDTTVTITLTDDYLVGAAGPGPKQVHLVLNGFRNPGPGLYDVELAIQPDPEVAELLEGTAKLRIIPKPRRSIDIVSVFSGGGPPPPFNNPLYQTVAAGDDSLDVGLYLWDKRSSVADGDVNPLVGVAVEMTNATHGHLLQAGRTVGHVSITAPAGADDHALSTDGPSILGTSAVTSLPVGILITRLTTDPDVVGDYVVTFRLNGGNSTSYTVSAG